MSDDPHNEILRHAETRVGRTLKEKWTLDQLLGVGGMASVYAATHRNQKRVAIKVLHPELSFNPALRQRFLREGYVANTVQHPGAVSVFDDDVSEDGCAFLVMELLDGETLEARWERKGKRLPPGEVLAFIDRVLETLTSAHARGVVHRDLKPENLFLTRDAQVKVLDFGIARVREASSGSKTQTGSLMGTPAFMPPEQARGRWDEVDAQSDLWAVGATTFTLLSGHFVHEAATVNEALVLAVTQPARSLGVVRYDLPDELIAFVDRALAYDKQARFPDATSMQAALRETYASLEAAWDERTVLADAAASLPKGQLTAPGVAATATDLAASASTPPATGLSIPVWAIGAAAACLALVLVGIFALGGDDGDSQTQTAARAPSVAPAEPMLSTKPATPPAVAVEDLPALVNDPPKPSPSQATLSPKSAPSVASPAAVPQPQMKPRPVPMADPFAGRD